MRDFFSSIWQPILDAFHWALTVLHQGLEPVFNEHAWGWAIIALTVLVRVALLPLAIKQTRSMKAMQQLQPKVKKLQAKYKVDRDLLKKDPETYRAKKQKLNEEMMALYKEEGVNPAGGCLPLLAQAPIFFALFSVLRDTGFDALQQAPFYFFTAFANSEATFRGLGIQVNQAGWPGWLLIALMAATMFWSQRQMMARGAAEGAQAQQQKMMMYIMPVFLAVVSLNFPMGVLLYWVTTNIWQMGQQAVIMREVEHHPNPDGAGASASPNGDASKAKTTPKKTPKTAPKKTSTPGTPKGGKPKNETTKGSKAKGDHLPKRKSSGGK